MDSRLVRATLLQHRRRRRSLADGASHVGWKVGAGDREFLDGMSVGYLTSETQLRLGGVYPPGPREQIHADAEVAVLIGPDGQPAGYACALELCDLAGDDGPEVGHRAQHLPPRVRPGAGGWWDTDKRPTRGRRPGARGGAGAGRPGRAGRAGPCGAARRRRGPGRRRSRAHRLRRPASRFVPGEQVRAEMDDLGSVTLLRADSALSSRPGSRVAGRRRARWAPAPGTPDPG